MSFSNSPPQPKNNSPVRAFLVLTAICLLILPPLLAWLATGGTSMQGWMSFLYAVGLGALLLWGGWGALRASERPPLPTRLAYLLVSAALLRLLAGVVWQTILPEWGHGSPAEQVGYIMADAYQRDQAAWELAESGKTIWSAFQARKTVDQYGGMLFISAVFYRYLGGVLHQPLQMVVLAASISALAVPLTWALARRLWQKERIAWLAAWIVVLFPDAVLLGSSQMREAFTITFTAAAFYGLIRYIQDKTWTSWLWISLPLLFFLPFSPPSAALLAGMLALTALPAARQLIAERHLKSWVIWTAIGLLALLLLLGVWFSLSQFTPEGMNNPLSMIEWWLRKSADLQFYLSKIGSGWVQKIFRNSPEWLHMPLLLIYGALQPFLPAGLIAQSLAPIWQGISAWRSLGWTLILALLICAPIHAVARRNRDWIVNMLIIVVWISILVAALRGGGDLWDNPRYRLPFLPVQASLAAWVLLEQQRSPDPWFRRLLAGIIAVLLWFVPFYLRRYTEINWPVSDLFKTLGLGLATAVLYGLWDWTRRPLTGKAREL